MAQHPLNLVVRFVLEITALMSMGYWGWTVSTGFLRPVMAILVPATAGVIWSTFRVPNDPGSALVPVKGRTRLVVEVIFFGFAFLALWQNVQLWIAIVFGCIVLIHYAISYDRIVWLLNNEQSEGWGGGHG